MGDIRGYARCPHCRNTMHGTQPFYLDFKSVLLLQDKVVSAALLRCRLDQVTVTPLMNVSFEISNPESGPDVVIVHSKVLFCRDCGLKPMDAMKVYWNLLNRSRWEKDDAVSAVDAIVKHNKRINK